VPFASLLAPIFASPISWLNPETLLESAGPIAIWVAAAIIFAECGLLFGFFLPGDSLLFVVGLFVGNGTIDMPIALVCALLFVAAFAGNLVGYAVGYHTGPALSGVRTHGSSRRSTSITPRSSSTATAPRPSSSAGSLPS
jgi:membrane-associated protein